jgi:hypothetical protein
MKFCQPPILLLGWLNKGIGLLQNDGSPGASCVVLGVFDFVVKIPEW